jgi:hypothetical protein
MRKIKKYVYIKSREYFFFRIFIIQLLNLGLYVI